MSTTAPPTPTCPAERFALILLFLRQVLCAAASQDKALAPAVMCSLWRRVTRVSERLTRLLTAFREGSLRPRRTRARRPEAARGTATERAAEDGSGAAAGAGAEKPPIQKPDSEKLPLPRVKGWMIQWGSRQAATAASRLQFWLQDPEVQALIAAEPARAGRLLRPLCFGLNVPLPPELVLPRRPRRKRSKPAATSGASGKGTVRRKRLSKAELRRECQPGWRRTVWDEPLIPPKFRFA